MSLPLPIGISDFRQLRQAGAYYIDKTGYIRQLLDLLTPVTLFPRPRRFGKTTNLSMLRAFFEKSEEDLAPLFAYLSIFAAGPMYRAHFQRHPVIHLSFKDTKSSTFADCYGAIKQVIMDECERHSTALLGTGMLAPSERKRFEDLLSGQAQHVDYWAALRTLSRYLQRVHKEQVVILVDEYDVPIQASFTHGYYEEVVEFFRNLLTGGLKDNTSLFRGVLTGVLRVAKESIFSGLNNIVVYSQLDPEFATAFGFTEPEVQALSVALGQPALMDQMRAWYDGYRFGGQVIYNPWSVLNFAQRPALGFRPYWVFTSAEDVLRQLVLERGYSVQREFAQLLSGGSVASQVSEHVVLRDLETDPGALWSLLLSAGYLTAHSLRLEEGRYFAELRIPNLELRYVFEQSILSWVAGEATGQNRLDELLAAMLHGDTRGFAAGLSLLARRVLSSHDTGGKAPERVYQGFVLGTLVRILPSYEVLSNREDALGRYDVAVLPRQRGRPGVVLEFKLARGTGPEAVAAALDRALAQVEERGYGNILRERGAQPIWTYGVACRGKQVWVRRDDETEIHGFSSEED